MISSVRFFCKYARKTSWSQSKVLKKLAASDISIEMPDISDSLRAVRNYRQMRENEPAGFAERSVPPSANSAKHPKASGTVPAKRPKLPKADVEGSTKAAQ